MIEVFIALILGTYYIVKYISHKAEEIAHDSATAHMNAEYKSRKSKWIAKVTDLELEKDVYEIVNDFEKLKEHKDEIEPVLLSEFGALEGAIENRCFLDGYGHVYDTARKMFARILMGNRGKLLGVDAEMGIFLGDTDSSTWPFNVKIYNKNKVAEASGANAFLKCGDCVFNSRGVCTHPHGILGYVTDDDCCEFGKYKLGIIDSGFEYSELALGFWINRQLRLNGIDERFYLEAFQDMDSNCLNWTHYYVIKGDEDLTVIEEGKKQPRRDFSHSYCTNGCEYLKWKPQVRGASSLRVREEPVENYSYWHEKK